MGLLKRKPADPIAALEAELGKLREREAHLVRRHADAEAAFEQVKTLRRAALVEDVDSAMSVVSDADLAAAAAQLATLRDAVAEIARRRQEVEAKLVLAKDAVERDRVARLIGDGIAEIEQDAEAFRKSTAALVNALGAFRAGEGLAHILAGNLSEGLQWQMATVLAELKSQRDRIADGTAPVPSIAAAKQELAA
jgi:hypothetical protein